MKIFIDPGHGGHDSGAVGFNSKEKVFALDIATKAANMFKNLGHKVYISRTDDTFIALTQRARMANSWGADLFISFHCNSGGGRGVEVWHSIHGGKGKDYARLVDNQLRSINTSRGLKCKQGKHGDFIYVLRATSMPAILIEFGFMDNKADTDLLKDANIRTRYAQAVVNAITGEKATTTTNNTSSGSLDGRMAICTGNGVRLRSTTDISSTSNILGHLNKGDKIKIFKKVGNMYSVYYGEHGAYVSANYISLI
ncbi:N-acetylmuramoyl-L-alanine amidase [Clostridium massiliodielmoense]|uniref:N-acetylmuramoyl-L-alanine amidase n=1 Tax=Clostridium massiliodielmoense TaxID=1776385 RepID=UPI000A266F64|nr:N-acetylmuramoyl-L-alanine amidase [Clostridium massiliodielmoense]